jgi:hypothetical protein
VTILTDDNFSTMVKAVELGRGGYDNLTRYIRFQMGGLFAYIATFLGASIHYPLNARRVPGVRHVDPVGKNRQYPSARRAAPPGRRPDAAQLP